MLPAICSKRVRLETSLLPTALSGAKRSILTVLSAASAMLVQWRCWSSWLFCCLTCLICPPWRGGSAPVLFWSIYPIERGPLRETALWGISCAFSWTYAFLSSLSADQSSYHRDSESGRLLGKSDGLGVCLQRIRRTTRPLIDRATWAP